MERAHRVGGDSDARGVDVGALGEVRDGLHDVGDHVATEAWRHLGAGNEGVVGAGLGGAAAVALVLADGIVGEDDRSGARIEDAGVVGVPGGFIAGVAVDDDDGGNAPAKLFGAIDDGGNAHSVESGVGDALGDDAGDGSEASVVARSEGRKRVGDEKGLLDLRSPFRKLLRAGKVGGGGGRAGGGRMPAGRLRGRGGAGEQAQRQQCGRAERRCEKGRPALGQNTCHVRRIRGLRQIEECGDGG
jgi:hypothetical protein